MSDPIEERLRSYYRSIQGDVPARLETRVGRALYLATTGPARPGWRPAFGLIAAVAAIALVTALVVRGLLPVTGPGPSGAIGPSAPATATTEPSASASPLGPPPTAPATPFATFGIVPTPTPGPTHTLIPSATPRSTPSPAVQFSLTGSMTTGRDGPTATLLGNGKVLIAGGKVASGIVERATATAELYDPATGKFTATGSMTAARWGHTATLLASGKVLIAGGADLSDGADNLATAEIYDPATGRFTATGSMSAGRAWQTATLLADGRVLIAGGANSIGLTTAEIYDPATGRFTATGSMTVARQSHTATRLADGRVLIAGGTAEGVDAPFGVQPTAEIYDPATGKFTATGSMQVARERAAAALLADGTVMIVGGLDENSVALNSAELYDPSTGKFGPAGAGIPDRATSRTVTLLTDGEPLTIGWLAPGAAAATYDGGHNNFYSAGSTKLDFGCQTATLLPGGRVLLLGGTSAGGKPNAKAGLYTLGGQS